MFRRVSLGDRTVEVVFWLISSDFRHWSGVIKTIFQSNKSEGRTFMASTDVEVVAGLLWRSDNVKREVRDDFKSVLFKMDFLSPNENFSGDSSSDALSHSSTAQSDISGWFRKVEYTVRRAAWPEKGNNIRCTAGFLLKKAQRIYNWYKILNVVRAPWKGFIHYQSDCLR